MATIGLLQNHWFLIAVLCRLLVVNQTCHHSLIQSETEAITPSEIRPQSEKIAPIFTSFIYVIIEENFWKFSHSFVNVIELLYNHWFLIEKVRAVVLWSYCPNFSLKFHHLNPKQPSKSLPFLHYKLVTEHFFSEMAVFSHIRLLRKHNNLEFWKSVLWPIRNGGMADY